MNEGNKSPASADEENVSKGSRVERAARFTTVSAHPIRPLYTSEDLASGSEEGWNPNHDLGSPGEPPYTRGIHPQMYRDRLWTMRQFAGFGSAQDTNQRFRYLLSKGQTGISVAFDLPTLMGYDSDHVLAEGEVGKCGVAISSLADMEELFDRIPLGSVSTSMTINSPAAIVWAMYLAVAEKQGVDWTDLSGTLQNDILKEYIAQKEYIYPPAASMRLVIDTIEFGARQTPEVQSHFHQRISHSGGGLDGHSGTGVHIARRNRIRGMVPSAEAWRSTTSRRSFHFSSMPTTISLKRLPNIAPPADLAQNYDGAIRREIAALAGITISRADRRMLAHGAAAVQQRGSHRTAGPGSGYGRHAIAAHQFAG